MNDALLVFMTKEQLHANDVWVVSGDSLKNAVRVFSCLFVQVRIRYHTVTYHYLSRSVCKNGAAEEGW